jgi:hypothetical protein
MEVFCKLATGLVSFRDSSLVAYNVLDGPLTTNGISDGVVAVP